MQSNLMNEVQEKTKLIYQTGLENNQNIEPLEPKESLIQERYDPVELQK